MWYVGIRYADRCRVWRIDEKGKCRPLAMSHRSPRFPSDQWEWGYAGSGPANLSHALCEDVTQDRQLADEVYQSVKWQVISRLPHDSWVLSDSTLTDAIDRAGQEALHEAHGLPANADNQAVQDMLGRWISPEDQVIDLNL